MSGSDVTRALEGEDLPVDFSAIEKSLGELWRTENDDSDHAVTRAALWNVVAHTENDRDKTFAGETLAGVSATVPQRTILVRANPSAKSEIAAWISANCHLIGGEKQVCSEEISIVAGGVSVGHVPPLVDALLLPELPVAAWWVGDLPHEREDYMLALLSNVDRLILDSARFDSVDDLTLFSRFCVESEAFPSDLNWERLEEWRLATAAVFDPPYMRSKLQSIRTIHVVSGISDEVRIGECIESFYYAAWINVQLNKPLDFRFERARGSGEVGAVSHVRIEFTDGASVAIERNRESGTLKINVAGLPESAATISPTMPRTTKELIVRQLSHRSDDVVFRQVIGPATDLARRVLAG